LLPLKGGLNVRTILVYKSENEKTEAVFELSYRRGDRLGLLECPLLFQRREREIHHCRIVNTVIDYWKPFLTPEMAKKLEDESGHLLLRRSRRDRDAKLDKHVVDLGCKRNGTSTEEHADKANDLIDIFLQHGFVVLQPFERHVIESDS